MSLFKKALGNFKQDQEVIKEFKKVYPTEDFHVAKPGDEDDKTTIVSNQVTIKVDRETSSTKIRKT